MHQNCEEMRTLREQNKEMHNDVRLIKELLKASREGNITGLPFPIDGSNQQHPPSYTTQTHGQATALSPKGPGMMQGGSIANRASVMHRITHSSSIENSQMSRMENSLISHNSPMSKNSHMSMSRPHSHYPNSHMNHPDSQLNAIPNSRAGGFRSTNINPRSSGQSEGSGDEKLSPSARGSPDLSARTISPAKMRLGISSQMTQLTINNNSKSRAKTPQNLPPVCSIKEGVVPLQRQTSSRGGRSGLRRGGGASKK